MCPSEQQNGYLAQRSRGAWQGALAFWARTTAAAMVVLLIVGTQARSFALFRCELTGVALTACCCPGEEGQESAAISRACCCSVEHFEARLPTGSTAPQTVAHLPYAPQSWQLMPLVPELRAAVMRQPQSAGMRRYAERTRAGPSLTIVHRRLLI
jgi:hypothetical protein